MVPLSFKVNLVNDGVSGLVSVTDLTIEIDCGGHGEGEFGKPSCFCISAQFVVRNYSIIGASTSTLKGIIGKSNRTVRSLVWYSLRYSEPKSFFGFHITIENYIAQGR